MSVPTPEEIALAALTMLEALREGLTDGELGPGKHFSCEEIESIAGLYRAAGQDHTAKEVITAHATGDDDVDDEHHDLYLKYQDLAECPTCGADYDASEPDAHDCSKA